MTVTFGIAGFRSSKEIITLLLVQIFLTASDEPSHVAGNMCAHSPGVLPPLVCSSDRKGAFC